MRKFRPHLCAHLRFLAVEFLDGRAHPSIGVGRGEHLAQKNNVVLRIEGRRSAGFALRNCNLKKKIVK